MTGTPDTRSRILDSAAAVITREGVGRLTLERVAREAGISKGGLLYHFNAKERLVEALIERLIATYEADLAAFEREEANGSPGRRTRAFVRATVEDLRTRRRDRNTHGIELFTALLAAAASNPKLLAPLRSKYREWQSNLERDKLPWARATILRLAADGIWFAELFQLSTFAPAQKRRLVQEMLQLTQPERAASGKRGRA